MADEKPTREQLLEQADEFDLQVLEKIEAQSTELNNLVKQIKALGGDQKALIESLRNSTDDEKIVKLNENIGLLKEKLEEYETALENYLTEKAAEKQSESKGDVDQLKKQEDQLRKKVMAGRNYLKSNAPSLEGLFPKLERISTGSSKVGTTGIRRLRGLTWTVGEKSFENTTDAAKELSADTANLQAAFFKATGTEDASKFPAEVTFTYDSKEVKVTKQEQSS